MSALKRVFLSTFVGGAIVGSVGFAAGFFGPIIFMPDSNQGPLLGIFITGPLGFVVGAVGGFGYGVYRASQSRQSGEDNDSRS